MKNFFVDFFVDFFSLARKKNLSFFHYLIIILLIPILLILRIVIKYPKNVISIMIPITLIGIIFAVWRGISKYQESELQQMIGEEIFPQLEDHKSFTSSDHIVIRGKVLVWDLDSNSRSNINNKLPKQLRPLSSKDILTVFLVSEKNVHVGYYSVSGKPAYRQDAYVDVVYWPSKESVGSHYIKGGDPEQVRTPPPWPFHKFIGAGYGDCTKAVANWIKGLPIENKHL